MHWLIRGVAFLVRQRGRFGFSPGGMVIVDATSNKNLAGPLVFEPSAIQRDAALREDNDGTRIDDGAVVEYVNQNKGKIFGLQSQFFAELRAKLSGTPKG
jgi:hypothetical protein